MSNFEEQSRFPETGRMVMPGDSVIGGPNAPINLTFGALFDRTRWLKNTLAEYKAAADRTDTQKADKTIQLTAGAGLTGGGTLAGSRTFALGTPSKITATSTNVAVSNTHSHEIDKASTTQAGIVRLSSDTDSADESKAATPKAVKDAYDKAVAAKEAADGAVKTTASQDIGGEKTFTAAATFKAGAFVADSVGDFAANQYLQIGSNNVNSYLHNKKSNKFLSMRNDGELRYDGKRVAMLPDLSNVSRRDYSREQTPVNTAYASERYKTEGSVSVYPDGHIVQTFWLKVVAHTFWLPEELPGFQVASTNDVSVALSLWTAMPNKVTNVQVQTLRCSDPNKSNYYYAEAAELPAAWALRKQKGNKNTVWLDIGRIAGSMGNDRIDIFVNVEGY